MLSGSSVATGRGKEGKLPPSLSKTVSEIRPDPLRFIFEGWGTSLDLDLPAAGLLFCFVKHNFFPTASVRHLIVNAMVLTA